MGAAEDSEQIMSVNLTVGDFRVAMALLRSCDWDLQRCEQAMRDKTAAGRDAAKWFGDSSFITMRKISDVRNVVKHVQLFMSTPIRFSPASDIAES